MFPANFSEVIMQNEIELILSIAKHFRTEGAIVQAYRYGSGHINDTYRLDTAPEGGTSYLLQRINRFIFPDAQNLMENVDLVCRHLQTKLAHLGKKEVQRKTLTIIPTHTNQLFYKDTNGESWRMFWLIENTHSVDVVTTKMQAYAAGIAFGSFQRELADLDAKKIHVVLPRFHDIEHRLENLHKALRAHRKGRAKEEAVEVLLREIASRETAMCQDFLQRIVSASPLRIIHNDTKFNNVLLDRDDQPQCVIDLDTVMPGYVAFDFGDAIRTIINRGREDERDLNKVKLNVPLYEAYVKGYLEKAGAFLTDGEIESLLYGVYLLPFMQVVRFLTDYIEYDPYYKTQFSNHNLVRAQAQFKLLTELESQRDKLRSIIQHAITS